MSSLIIPNTPLYFTELIIGTNQLVTVFNTNKITIYYIKFFEVLLTLVIALTITLIDYHIVIKNSTRLGPLFFALCLLTVQIAYAEQNYKIS